MMQFPGEHIQWGTVAGWMTAAVAVGGWIAGAVNVVRRIDRMESNLDTRLGSLESSHTELVRRLDQHIDKR